MTEEWRPVAGWPYEVSSVGRVRRVGGGIRTHHIEKRSGYPYVHLRNGKAKSRTFRVHVLVAGAFVGCRPSPSHQVSHEDFNPSNNDFRNLRWREPYDHHVHDGRVGTGHRLARLTDSLVRELRAKVLAGATYCELARLHGLNSGTVWAAVNRRTWRHIP